jgi:hypothetical protein
MTAGESSAVPAQVAGVLAGAQPAPAPVAQDLAAGPFAAADLANQPGLRPLHAARMREGRGVVDGLVARRSGCGRRARSVSIAW